VFADTGLAGVEYAIDETSPDCVVVSSYDRILPARVLARSRFVNVHYAPLPQYRGRANVNWAIINGERETAITVHVMAPGLDAGNVLHQQRVPIGPDDTVGDLYERLNEVQRQVLGDVVARHLDGYEGAPQDESGATYGCTRVPDDGQIDWAAPTEQIYALVRALAPPYPGAHSYLEGRRLGVVRAAPLQEAPHYIGRIPGRVVGRSLRTGHVDVLTADGVLRLHELAEGGVVGPAAGFVESTRQTLGLRTCSPGSSCSRAGSASLRARRSSRRPADLCSARCARGPTRITTTRGRSSDSEDPAVATSLVVEGRNRPCPASSTVLARPCENAVSADRVRQEPHQPTRGPRPSTRNRGHAWNR
jgi:methionyl-tRNA formyltransferase